MAEPHQASEGAYRPALHQASLTGAFDMAAARSASSFDKLWRDVATELRSRWHGVIAQGPAGE